MSKDCLRRNGRGAYRKFITQLHSMLWTECTDMGTGGRGDGRVDERTGPHGSAFEFRHESSEVQSTGAKTDAGLARSGPRRACSPALCSDL